MTFGKVKSVTLPKSKENENEGRGFAFVEMSDQESFQVSIIMVGFAQVYCLAKV